MLRSIIICLMFFGLVRASSADTRVTTVANLEFHSAFWLNLHHVLFAAAWSGRPETGARRLIGPPPSPLAADFSDDERAAWNAAIGYYNKNIADRDLRAGLGMTAIKRALAQENLSAEGVGEELLAQLLGLSAHNSAFRRFGDCRVGPPFFSPLRRENRVIAE